MKKRIPTFLAGMISMAAICALTLTVLAATGTVKFNQVNISLNGTAKAKAGETYALTNGCQAPYSISYVDEKGGSTTYLSVRKVSELLGTEINWDGDTKTVNVGEDAQETTTDYSDWTEEEDNAYKEFKDLWEIHTDEAQKAWILKLYPNNISNEDLKEWLASKEEKDVKKFSTRYSNELIDQYLKPLSTDGTWDFDVSYFIIKDNKYVLLWSDYLTNYNLIVKFDCNYSEKVLYEFN